MRTATRLFPGYRNQGIVVGPGPPSTGLPPPSNLGPHIVDWIRQPGNQVIVVPDGNYDMAGMTTIDPNLLVHPPQLGTYKGWLILIAQNYLGASITSTSNDSLYFDGGLNGANGRDFRVAFIGFNIDGFAWLRIARKLKFVWTVHTNPIDRWWTTYTGLGGTMAGNTNDVRIRDSIVRWPSAFRLEPLGYNVNSPQCQYLDFICNDIHDVGDDAIYTSNVYHMNLYGYKSWRIGPKGFDPGPFPNDFFHPDGLQVTGDFKFNTIQYSWFGGNNLTFSAYANGSVDTVNFYNIWLAGSLGIGMIITKSDKQWISNSSIDTVGAFCNGQNWDNNWSPHYIASNDKPFYERVLDSNGTELVTAIWPSQLSSSNPADGPLYKWEMPITNVSTSIPSDVRTTSGNIVDINDLVNSAFNPANVYRATHPYSTVLTWLTNEFGWD